MDEILKGLLLSNHPSKLKLDTLEKIAKVSNSKHAQSEKVCNSIYGTCLNFLRASSSHVGLTEEVCVHEKDDPLYAAVQNLLSQWIFNNQNYYEEFLKTAYLDVNLNDVNLVDYLDSLHCCLLHYKNCFQLHGLSYKMELANTVAKIIMENTNFKVLVSVCQFCLRYPMFVGMQDVHVFKYKFSKQVMNIVCKHPFKFQTGAEKTAENDSCVVEEDESEINKFDRKEISSNLYKDLDCIYTLFSHVVSTDLMLMKFVGNLLFKFISSPSANPSINLARFLPCLKLEVVTEFLEEMMATKNIDDSLSHSLLNLIDFACYPDESLGVNEWVIQFMKCLIKYNKYNILFEAIEAKIQQVCNLMLFKQTRKSCVSILTFMLVTYLHSPHLFHKIIPSLESILGLLKKDGSGDALQTVNVLVELVFTMMFHYPGYPDLYAKLMDILKEHERPTEDKMRTWLKSSSNLPKLTLFNTWKPRTAKSDTGKIGLDNLGNTCYANSVIQALLNSKSFCEAILSKQLVSNLQKVTFTLQRLFALLLRSQRPSISPDYFIDVSRPQWFRKGAQQDCSEYLKHLLDVLENEEKMALHENVSTKHFTGVMKVAVQCLTCNNLSMREEVFNDIPLSFDEIPMKNCTLKGGDSSERIERKMSLSVDPSANKDVSEVSPVSTEQSNAEESNNANGLSKKSIVDLINDYFVPENLTDQNQYFCEKCKKLVDAVTWNELIHFPKYMILTLKRFTFDSLTQQRNKILQVLEYPKEFYLCTVCGRNSNEEIHSPKTVAKNNQCCNNAGVHYQVSSVVVHSGVSSESGHYYCYVTDKKFGNELEWFLMNDSRVSRTQSNCLDKLGASFPRDSPYICIYEKVEEGICSNDSSNETACSQQVGVVEHKLSEELLEYVAKDDEQYFKEESRFQMNSSRFNQKFFPHNNDDDDNGGGSGGGGGFNCASGSSGINSTQAGRFIF